MPQTYLFDAYGTLFDLSSALTPLKERLGDAAPAILDHWRTLQLEYAWLSALGDHYIDFEKATRNAFIDSLHRHDLDADILLPDLMNSFRRIKTYPDAAECLTQLKKKNKNTAILSNGTEAMLQAATVNADIAHLLDAIISVDPLKTYKPHPAAYALGTKFSKSTPNNVTFVSSNWWDVVGATNFGFQTIWVDRGTMPWPASIPKPADTIPNLLAVSDRAIS